MSTTIRHKEAFHVIYRLKGGLDHWRDYFGRPRTFMTACEELEKLTAERGLRYEFKAIHANALDKAIGKAEIWA